MLQWKDIPQRTQDGNYCVSYAWEDLEYGIDRYTQKYRLDLTPDFQRGHVWTLEQRVRYLESKFSGGAQNDIIRFNCPGWQRNYEGQMVCVDGLQRLTTALMFLRNEIAVFGGYTRSQISGGNIPPSISFQININNLPTTLAVIRWYLEINSGGTPHSPDELARVQAMYLAELAKAGGV